MLPETLRARLHYRGRANLHCLRLRSPTMDSNYFPIFTSALTLTDLRATNFVCSPVASSPSILALGAVPGK
ncbi:unnamed protein product [Fusarium graminearum]|uniref:Uncharacterized protein n=1 Tax=Gibberella zeae TaxID=5518 RepID=A0A4U9F3I5_GIBZA|nr:unnamed protein product [Fusarium graminearum]VTO89325.1 unnamed protein product [Fusarium graminearum]